MDLFLSMIVGLCFFISTIKAYSVGIKHGKEIGKGIVPSINLNPAKAYKEHVEAKEEKKATDEYAEAWSNILSYTGDLQKEGDK
jgi:hypothetical protein